MLIQSFLELTPGVFAIFYHHALGKTTAKKADDRALSFILGVEIYTAIIFLITYIIVNFCLAKIGALHYTVIWTISGIFLIEAIITFFFYFRPTKAKNSTELFLPRRLARSLIYHAEHANNRSSTIILGFVTSSLELFFTLPLYVILSICIFYNFNDTNFVSIIAYIIIATIPLFAIRTFFRTDRNLAEIIRLRIKKKLPTRLVLFTAYFFLAIITFIIGFSI